MKKTILLILFITLSVTLFVTHIPKQYAQSGNDGQLYFTTNTSSTPITQLRLLPGQQTTVKIYLNAGSSTSITAFDFTIRAQSNVTLTNLTPGADASRFDTFIFNDPDTANNSIRFGKLTKNVSGSPIRGQLHLATITVTSSSTVDDPNDPVRNLTITNAVVTATTTTTTPLSISVPTIPYQIVSSLTPVPSGGITQFQIDKKIVLPGITDIGGLRGNADPKTKKRPFKVEVVDQSNVIIATGSGDVDFDQTTKRFGGNISLSEGQMALPAGSYTIKVSTPRYLRKTVPGLTAITSPAVTVPTITLVIGDINEDNRIDIRDYNVLLDCGALDNIIPQNPPTNSAKYASQACQAHTPKEKTNADLNDDGAITIIDYNLWFNSIAYQYGD